LPALVEVLCLEGPRDSRCRPSVRPTAARRAEGGKAPHGAGLSELRISLPDDLPVVGRAGQEITHDVRLALPVYRAADLQVCRDERRIRRVAEVNVVQVRPGATVPGERHSIGLA
jgi:hypothetical protein